jgi:hypothetical protein
LQFWKTTFSSPRFLCFLYEIFSLVYLYFRINKARTHFSRTWFWFSGEKKKERSLSEQHMKNPLRDSVLLEKRGFLANVWVFALLTSGSEQKKMKLSFECCLSPNNHIMLTRNKIYLQLVVCFVSKISFTRLQRSVY